MDRRGVFFLLMAGICALLVPAAPPDLSWVPRDVAIAYGALALISFADFASHRREEHPRR